MEQCVGCEAKRARRTAERFTRSRAHPSLLLVRWMTVPARLEEESFRLCPHLIDYPFKQIDLRMMSGCSLPWMGETHAREVARAQEKKKACSAALSLFFPSPSISLFFFLARLFSLSLSPLSRRRAKSNTKRAAQMRAFHEARHPYKGSKVALTTSLPL